MLVFQPVDDTDMQFFKIKIEGFQKEQCWLKTESGLISYQLRQVCFKNALFMDEEKF